MSPFEQDPTLRSEVLPPPPTPTQLLLAACVSSAVVAVIIISIAAMLSRATQIVAPVIVEQVVQCYELVVVNDDTDVRVPVLTIDGCIRE
jgi:hypothetical protein